MVEGREGRLLSPYAATKMVNELDAGIFQDAYGIETVGLRYFNVFGPRQDPNGPYAAVIPRWVLGLLRGQPCEIYGDGQTSRDFCYVDNAVQANLLAVMVGDLTATNQVYNVACADYTTLNELFGILREEAAGFRPEARGAEAVYRDFRKGDVRQSLADIGSAMEHLGYAPTHMVREGLGLTVGWYGEAVREGWLFAA